MKRDDVLRMAREAGISIHTPDLERFAAVVAAAEREAMIAEAETLGWAMRNEDPFEDAVSDLAAIRARKDDE